MQAFSNRRKAIMEELVRRLGGIPNCKSVWFSRLARILEMGVLDVSTLLGPPMKKKERRQFAIQMVVRLGSAEKIRKDRRTRGGAKGGYRDLWDSRRKPRTALNLSAKSERRSQLRSGKGGALPKARTAGRPARWEKKKATRGERDNAAGHISKPDPTGGRTNRAERDGRRIGLH